MRINILDCVFLIARAILNKKIKSMPMKSVIEIINRIGNLMDVKIIGNKEDIYELIAYYDDIFIMKNHNLCVLEKFDRAFANKCIDMEIADRINDIINMYMVENDLI